MAKRVHQQEQPSPFRSIANLGEQQRLHAITLALAFRVARDSDQVWAACRMARALAGYKGDGVSGYLSGKHFSGPYACNDDEQFPTLDVLKMLAEDFLAEEEVG